MFQEAVLMTGGSEPSMRGAGAAALALCALWLGGCRPAAAPPPAAPSTRANPAADAAALDANRVMAAGVPVGVTSAAVDVRFNLGAVPRPGEPLALEVAVLPRGPVPLLSVEVSASDGLEILEPTGQVRRERVEAGSLVHVHVRASAGAAGTYVVHVRATLQLLDGSDTEEFAFPVLVGEGAGSGASAAVPSRATAPAGPPPPGNGGR